MPDTIEQYYEQTGARYRMSSTRRERVLSLLSKAIGQLHGGQLSIMDIGIGSGEVADYCHRTFAGKKFRLTGVDISQSLLKAHAGQYTDTVCTNVDAIGWTASFKQEYDIVVASELVEHLFRPDTFLKSVRDIVKPDGYVVISTPNMLLWSQRIKFLLGRHAWSDGGVFEWGHIHLFSWKFLQDQLARNGFRIIATNHLIHPNALNGFGKILPAGLFAFQFIVLAQKK